MSRSLPLRELQRALPVDQLAEVAALLRGKDGRVAIEPSTDKDFLSSLYEAFEGPDRLARRKEREHLLKYVTAEDLREAALKMGLSTDGSFSQLAARVSRFKWGPNAQTAAFLKAFGYPKEYLPEAGSAVQESEVLSPHVPYFRPLMDYQAPVAFSALRILRPPSARLMVQMPTGSGKTRTAMDIVASFLNTHPKARVGWVAHSEELCDQAAEAFGSVWRHVGQHPVALERYWREYRGRLNAEGPVFVVGGFAKLNLARAKGVDRPEFDLLVVDEAHMVLAPKYQEVVGWALRFGGRLIGLSATPGRTAGAGESTRLVDYFHQEIVGIADDDGDGVVQYLQRRGVLARLTREPLETRVSFNLYPDEWKELSESLDYPSAFLQRVARDSHRNAIILEKLLALAKDRDQVLVFATSVEQSRLLCACMIHQGVRAAHVDGKETSPEFRRATIASFRSGAIKFLFNYGVLSTGFDVPRLDTVVIARPTKSAVLYSQMVGRVMRGPSVGGTGEALLVDVIDNVNDYSGVEDVYESFGDYWA